MLLPVLPEADDRGRVQLADGDERRYRAVVVANGHLSGARMAHFPGRCGGAQPQSHHNRTATPFVDQNVLVIGIGNSAVDIAVDVCNGARRALLSTRRTGGQACSRANCACPPR